MSAWSGLAKGLSKLLGGGTSKAAVAASEAVQAGTRTVITWGNAFRVAVAGGFTFLFLNGGASNVVASTLGIGQDAAQILIIFGFIVLMILVTRLIVNYVRRRFHIDSEYFDIPVVRNIGRYQWNPD
ncbi:MAG: hypothetical protein E7Z62_02920 [Thermoplasmata archaeon]|nr:hypothetical protein [Thermoplasmata archaeon]MBE6523888.1 hypothetical protein [Thermoplasmata archaeon]